MFSYVRIGMVLLVGIIFWGCETSDENYFGTAFKSLPSTSTVVTKSNGGDVGTFVRAANEVKRKGWEVKIDGPCYSACTIFADRARTNVCVTKNAVFGFHKAVTRSNLHNVVLAVFDPTMSPDITSWVKRHGGYPPPHRRLLLMGFDDAKGIWRPCSA